MRTLRVVACAVMVALSGCDAVDAPPPARTALALGQHLAALDAELDGVAALRAPYAPAVQEHARTLWARAIRADGEVRKRLPDRAPAGDSLRRAAAQIVVAAAALQAATTPGEPPPGEPPTAAPQAALEEASRALAAAAGELAPHLPPSADGSLAALRRAP